MEAEDEASVKELSKPASEKKASAASKAKKPKVDKKSAKNSKLESGFDLKQKSEEERQKEERR